LLDHVNLERMGIPTVTFVTEPFESAARTHADVHGMPDLPLIIVPQDYLADASDEAVIARDQAVFDAVMVALTSSL
jgi:hypothetical protein